jgi:hypothetical protein
MTSSTTATIGSADVQMKERTTQLLVLLYEYITQHAPSHILVLSAVSDLRDAAHLYGQNDLQRAFQKGVDAYQSLMHTRRLSPDLPLP